MGFISLKGYGRLGAVAGIALTLMPLAAQAQTVRAAMTGALRVLDPMTTSATITKSYGYMVFDTLAAIDANFEPRPQMADWVISDDRLTYTFTLREGLKWHDGAPVTAQDCVASIKRWAPNDSIGRWLMDVAESMDVVDDRTFLIRVSKPTDIVLQALAKNAAPVPFMMPKRLAEKPISEPITEAIGSGPFKFVASEFKPGAQAVFVKNEDYVPRSEPASWAAGGKVVNVDRVEWVVMPDAQTAINAALNGEVDYVDEPALDLLPLVKGSDQVSVKVINPFGLQILGRMNHVAGPFADKAVRQALFLALDQQRFLAAMSPDPKYFKTCGAVFVCGTPYASEAGAQTLTSGGDLEAARKKLGETSYDGEEIRLIQPTDSNTQIAQPLVGSQIMKDVGFKVKMMPMDIQTAIATRIPYENSENRVWDMYYSALQGFDVSNPLTNNMIVSSGKKGMFGFPDDPETEALRAKFALASSEEERKQIAVELQKRVLENVTYIPLGELQIPAIVSNDLTNLVEGPSAPYFWGLEKRD